MIRALPATLALAASAMVAAGCNHTDITILTQAPPGRTAALDVDARTLTVSQGLAVALECTEVDENDGYGGPCRDMNVALDDTSLADVLPVHLDALAGQNVSDAYRTDDNSVTGPAVRQGVVLAAKAAGSATLTVTTKSGAPLPLTLVVAAPPSPPDDE